ncbi:MAG: T9SS type A sorting domain-containing protein [Bacteroidota bacterium]
MKFILFGGSLFLTFLSTAQWDPNLSNSTPIAIAPKSQDNCHLTSDTKGGALISWDDNRNSSTNSSDIYAQRMRKSGIDKWTVGGLSVCTHTATQKSSAITNTSDGSAIITWEDNRSGNYDIYAQKIDSSGNILWASNGIAVCAKTTNQKNPKITSDNNGGAIVVWEDSLNNYWDIYAQRISSTGTLLWTNTGVAVCNSPNTQNNPKLDTDGLGGAIFTWQDKRNNVDYDIYAQRLDDSGVSLWTSNGVLVCNSVNTQNNPRIEPDGSNGALVAWTDKRNAVDNNIYAQRINATGTVQWAANGLLVCGATNNQSALDIKFMGSSGLLLTWKDDRGSANAIYAQIVSMAGANQLTSNGILISNGSKSINPNVISDGNNGAIIAWQDSSSLGWDIKSQKINSSGTLQWTAGGVTVCNAADDQVNPSQVSDGEGGAIYAWEDHRNGSNYDIYCNHLFSNGSPVVGINELVYQPAVQSICFPNPINLHSIIQLNHNTSHLPWEIKIFDVYGNLVNSTRLNADASFSLNSSDYSSGIYFYVINLENSSDYSKGSFISAY